MPSSTPDLRWLRRVRALLAKADATDFQPEAEAFLTKAQELMTRHAIDETMLRAGEDSVATRVVALRAPCSSAKASLLGAVCRANECQVVVDRRVDGDQRCFLIGYPGDIDRAMVLFSALEVHATRMMTAGEPREARRVRAYRHAFLLAYAARVGERLRAARDAEWQQAAQRGGSALVMRRDQRATAVDAAMRAQFPLLAKRRVHASSAAGYRGGRSAADAAALGQRPLAAGRGLPPAGRSCD